MWYNKYVGIPYVEKGRDVNGVDCWGLVRLIYKDQYNIELPSFADEYIPKDTSRISELVHQYNEGWDRATAPVEGAGVLFNIYGHASHMGVMLDKVNFIHSIRGADTSISRIDSPKWAKRIEGYYTYVDRSKEVFETAPGPLTVAPAGIEIPEGFTVRNAFDAVAKNNGLPDRLKSQLVLFIDGNAVLEPTDDVITAGQRLEYRLTPSGDDVVRTVAVVALVVIAAPAAAAWAGTAATSALAGTSLAGTMAGSALVYGAGALATMATMSIGMQLINAVFPVRQPDMPSMPGDPGTSNPQLMLTGGRNESRTYGSIPLVLGQYRYNAPIAANTYSEIQTDLTYLRMLLCWGYGDVQVSDIRIGPTVLSEYDEITQYTDGNTLSTDNDTFANIKAIYGTDTTQIYPNTELLYTNSDADWVYRNIVEDVTDINVSLHFPEGLRGMYISGSSAGSIFPAYFRGEVQAIRLDDDLNEVGTWRLPGTAVEPTVFKLSNNYGALHMSSAYENSPTGPRYAWHVIYLLNGSYRVLSGPAFVNQAETTVGTNRTCTADGSSVWCSYVSTAPTVPSLPAGASFVCKVLTYSVSSSRTNIINYNYYLLPGYTGDQVAFDATSTNGVVANFSALTNPTLAPPINYGGSGEPFYIRKDGFSTSVVFANLPKGKYKIRARRTNSSEAEPSSDQRLYLRCILQAITGTVGTAPVNIPKDCSLALTALKIKATDQLNGSLEGVNALVTSICWDYDVSTSVLQNVTTTNGSNIITVPFQFEISMLVGDTLSGNANIPNGSTITSIATYTNTTGFDGFNYTTVTYYGVTISTNATSSGISPVTLSRARWVKQATRNPASLLRHVLQHPANAQRILDSEVAEKLDLPALEDWHAYCKAEGFNYDAVVTDRRSLLEVMKDIAAAGRASPILSNGKWSVIIDRPRTTVVQQFTPHNSWDFESTKLLPTVPHAVRVPFVNSKQEFQLEELVVYNDVVRAISATSTTGSANVTVSASDWANIGVGAVVVSSPKIPPGKSVISKTAPNILVMEDSSGITTGTATLEINTKYDSTNASLYESISLPGVTESSPCFKHARFHLAQARLRPEVYSLNVDIEHLVCNRGDLVRVMYDTPMWGTGSSRIDYTNTVSDTTTVFFRDPVILTLGKTYILRIRSHTGANSTHYISTISNTSEYTQVDVTPALTADQKESGNLILIGEVTKDSAELIVLSIEPSSNLSAKLTLVDYSPAVYDSDTELIPEFNTNITRPSFASRNYITAIPNISIAGIKSDETVMTLSAASYRYKIRVPFIVPTGLPTNITHIETRYCLTNDTSKSWRSTTVIPISTPNLFIDDVIEKASYSIQSRYISSTGYSGPWTSVVDHVVVGKTTAPAQVASLVGTFLYTEGTLLLNWADNLEIDITGYEVRTSNSGWGTSGYVYKGKTSEVRVSIPAVGIATTYYVKAIDAANLYSTAATQVTVTRNSPNQIYASSIQYSDTNLTSAQILLSWDQPTPSTFVVNKYKVTVNKPGKASYTSITGSNNMYITADWSVGDMSFSIICIDMTGAESLAFNGSSTKWAPNVPASFVVAPSQSGIALSWVAPAITTLPVHGYEVRTSDTNWGSSGGLLYKGSSNTVSTTQLVQGINTWFIRTFDTDGVYSSSTLSTSYTVNPPVSTVFTGAVFSDTSLTTAEVRLNWTAATPTFGLKGYELSYNGTTVLLSSTTIVLPANWIGERTFNLRVLDNIGGVSAYTILQVTKQLPNPVSLSTFRAQVIDNNVLLFWEYPAKTTLPISHAKLKRGSSWASGIDIGNISGTFSQILENKAGNYTYWISVVDTDNNESTPISLTTTVNAPPDYVFNAEYTADLSASTKVNSALDYGKLVMPINTSEDWQSHFSSRSWTGPDNQVSAGYPIYVQPSSTSGSMTEVFDYGTLLASSQITVDYTGTIVSGTPVVSITIGLSTDGVSFTDYTSLPVFGTNFRYIRLVFTVSSADGLGLYSLDEVSVRLDAKQKTDAGSSSFLDGTGAPNGNIVNFAAEFIDVSAITLTASGSTALTTAYDFRDAVQSGTYSASGTTCTITETAHGFLPGQKVRLYFTSGNAINGVYTITSVPDANTYVVVMNVVSATSGNHNSYPNSFRGYLFNATTGARVAGNVSWNVRGY